MEKSTGNQDGNNNQYVLIILVGFVLSISIIIVLWKYYDTKIADMESRVESNNRIQQSGNVNRPR